MITLCVDGWLLETNRLSPDRLGPFVVSHQHVAYHGIVNNTIFRSDLSTPFCWEYVWFGLK